MIVISSGKMQIPEKERFIGFCGDNLHSKRQFRLIDVTEPDCIYRLYLTFDDGTVNYFVLDSKVENSSTILTWNILEEHIFKSGTVQAQIKCIGTDGEIYHTTCDYFIVASSAEDTEFFADKENSEFLRYERELNSILSSINSDGGAFVPTSRKIAELSLSKDITVKDLQTALNTYPVLTHMYEPTAQFKGETGQLCVGNNMSDNPKLYMCFGRKSSGEYIWEAISGGDVDLSDYVQTGRAIAGLDSSQDISKYDLQNALETYPVIMTHTDFYGAIGEVGQLAVGNFYKGNPKLYICTKKEETDEIDIPYRYTWEEIGSGNISFRETDQKVDSGFAGEVGEIVVSKYGSSITVYICTQVNKDNNFYLWTQLSNNNLASFEFLPNANINSDYKGSQGQIVASYQNGKINVYICVLVNTEPEEYTWIKLTNDSSDIDLSEVEKTIANEIFEFSQTAIPKTFDWEQGNLDANGAEVDSPVYYRSDYIPIDDGFKYFLFVNNSTDSAENTTLYLYDENKALIAGYSSTYVTSAHTQKEYTTYVKGAKYARIRIKATLKDALIRFYYKEQVSLATKKELKKSTYGQPRSLSMLDYFGANKNVVFIGDSITQGVGSSDLILFSATDDNGNTINYSGNSEEYRTLHDLPMYETGKFLYAFSSEKFYEAIDGNGWAHKLKNYLQNKFGCTVKNYGMRGISSGTLAKYTMNSETSDLVTADEGDVTVFKGLTKGFDTVFIMIGTNDRSYEDIATFKSYLSSIVEHLKTTDNKNVILASASPIVDEDGKNKKTLTMGQVNVAVRDVALEYGVPFISLYEGVDRYCTQNGLSLSELMNADGVHPNDEGYEVMNALICEGLGINEVDKNYVDNALADFKLSDEDKRDIADLVVQMMNAQSVGETDA